MFHLLFALLLTVIFAALPADVYAPLRLAAAVPPPSGAARETGLGAAFSGPTSAASAQSRSAPPSRRVRKLTHQSGRLLAGPGDLTPQDYGAFGVIAFARPPQFPKDSSNPEARRFDMICKAFTAPLFAAQTLTPPSAPHAGRLVVTVWPMQSSAAAQRATLAGPDRACPIALQRYQMRTADIAIHIAAESGLLAPSQPGPFLMAWLPGAEFADPGPPILFDDLSDVTDAEAAYARLARWDQDILREDNYSRILAERLGPLAYVRLRLRVWADTAGTGWLDTLRSPLGRRGPGDA